MSRKGVGLAAFDRSRLTSAQYASHGSSLRSANAQALETQLAVFRSLLQQFAQTHAKDIRSNPTFRAQFARIDDILRAVGTLKPLGSAYSVIRVGSKPYIRSVPKELNTDQSAVLEAAQVLGYVSVSMLMVNLSWMRARAQTALEDLVGEGMLWVDKQTDGEWEYWSPGFMLENQDFTATAG
ncbi:hypothetical protein NEMBOFW57_000208 [Staphylotrichum longicolle]|uniref:Vacuolar-sorting protein SNF8 n=1 Tax=Staphylotrichum longicolle TaxID=669026 RepID=A0AAD4F007_9PEZI|nr:hypothetical protein NEMBOFW57_000208 [Staphylotrichum longicolle]